MGEQLSLKAAIPLAEILAMCRKNVSNTGPCVGGINVYQLNIAYVRAALIVIGQLMVNKDLTIERHM